ncbi:phosphonate metabolism transcriptional regulator PhnF [Rhodovibrio salinarum]|uniref:phosphonate metabolism transcriptional regulator PhnF n=1 Tax=Rhodovibrio salinarum TaxID=1087 RepID=UPI000483FF40|nr:phosphonate metabolism transcriptional regulator PhnF [Rhodovibrio salinarum]
MADLERRGGLAIWRQIAQELEAQIDAGALRPGAQLPTEAALAQRYGVNRHTARRAVADLEDRGLVTVAQGRGTFVCTELIDYRLSRRTRFSENIRRNKQTPGGKLLAAAVVQADRAIAERLQIPIGANVQRLDSLRTADGVPINLSHQHFPGDRFPGLADAVERHGAITPALAEYGVGDYTRRETRLSARPASRREARLLALAEGAPVLVAENLNVDPDGRPVEVSQTLYAADRVQLTVEP